MVDLIDIVWYRKHYKSDAEFVKVQDDLKERIDEMSGEKLRGGDWYSRMRYENFSITFYKERIVLHGSLWKYYKGNNIVEFSVSEISEALKRLSFDLDIKVEKGVLTKIEIAQNFEVNDPPARYIREIQRPNKMQYCQDFDGETVGFRNKSNTQQIIVYDKGRESEKDYELSEKPLPENLIRYEYRLNGLIEQKTKFGISEIRGAHLYSAKFLYRLLRLWYVNFFCLQWKPAPFYENVNGMKSFRKYMIAQSINVTGGIAAYFSLINSFENKQGHPWTDSARCKAKKILVDIVNDDLINKHSDLSIELKAKVTERFKDLKASLSRDQFLSL